MSNNDNNQTSIANASVTKKISFFSAILVVMGSSIGAGIFFRSGQVLGNSQGSLILAIFSWLIAALSVIAMGLALVEISSVRNDNLSLLGWTKVFNKRITFKASKNFMLYLYLPLNLFYMPLYLIQSFQDGMGAIVNNLTVSGDIVPIKFGTNVDWLVWTIISILISTYFIVVAGLNSKIGNIQNKIFTYLKFIPLTFVGIVGFVLVALNAGGEAQIGFSDPMVNGVEDSIEAGGQLSSFFPAIGLFLSVSAILFTYDGFYVVAGIQSELKEPKKTPLVILLGLVVTTAIYLFIAISMSINGGSFPDMCRYMENEWPRVGKILFGIVNIMIAIGIFGIINGYAIWMPRYVECLMKEGEVIYSLKYKDKLNEHKPKVGVVFYVIWTAPLVLLFSIIGALGYIDNYAPKDYGHGMGKLYTFADLIATWMSMFVFLFILGAILGGIINRKTKRISAKKSTYFLPMAWISLIIIGVSAIITIALPFIDLILICKLDKTKVELIGRNYNDVIISRIMLIVTLFLNASITYGTIYIEDKINIRKFGSLAKYEEWQRNTFNVT